MLLSVGSATHSFAIQTAWGLSSSPFCFMVVDAASWAGTASVASWRLSSVVDSVQGLGECMFGEASDGHVRIVALQGDHGAAKPGDEIGRELCPEWNLGRCHAVILRSASQSAMAW